MENLPILQDFVPYWGRCPASPMKTREKVEQGKGTADHLMPLGYLLLVFMGGKQGRGQSPVEWADFPYVSLSIHPSLWAIQPGLSPS